MHKYQPRVHVIRKDFSSDLSPTKPVPVGDGVKTFNFPETVFTTVTAYQNQQVRGHCGEPAASQFLEKVYLVFGEECLVLNDTEKLELETPVFEKKFLLYITLQLQPISLPHLLSFPLDPLLCFPSGKNRFPRDINQTLHNKLQEA